MNYSQQMNTYLRAISIEFAVMLLLCIICIVALRSAGKQGWISRNLSKSIITVIVILFMLISILFINDIFRISKDKSSQDYVRAEITFLPDEKYNLGITASLAKRYVYLTLENGMKIKLWVSNDFDFGTSAFSGVVVYGRSSNCIVELILG